MVASIALFLVSWAAGVGTYIAALYVFFGQRMELTSPRNGDFRFVVISSFVAFALLFGGVYLPLLFGLRRFGCEAFDRYGLSPCWRCSSVWSLPPRSSRFGAAVSALFYPRRARYSAACSLPPEPSSGLAFGLFTAATQ